MAVRRELLIFDETIPVVKAPRFHGFETHHPPSLNRMPAEKDILFRQYFERTYPRVKAYLVNALGANMHADDIAQDVYIRIWKHWDRLEATPPPDAWLFTVVRNSVVSHFRVKRLPIVELEEERHDQIPAGGTAPSLLHKEYYELYERTLRTFHTVKQRCFRLHWDDGLTYREIAEMEGISVKTVERHVNEIRRLLRTKLDVHALYVILLMRAAGELTLW